MKDDYTIQWTLRPDKKSVNFGLFKHPNSASIPTPKFPSSSFQAPPSPALRPETGSHESNEAPKVASKAVEKLQSVGLKLIKWYGSCEANRVFNGQWDVVPGEGGMYALVFDNTFSKQHSKKVTFAHLTHPSKSPPKTDSQVHDPQTQGLPHNGNSSAPSVVKKQLAWRSPADSAHSVNESAESQTFNDVSKISTSDMHSSFFTGTLQKRRRRKHQGWARRFFSLDYSTNTLSYYHDQNTRSLRGAIPLSLAAIGANAKTRQISIDSGVEVWHLKAPSAKDFAVWKDALEKAHSPHDALASGVGTRRSSLKRISSMPPNSVEDQREWSRVDDLVTRLKSSRNAARTIAKDTDPKYLSPPTPLFLDTFSGHSSASESPSEQSMNGYFTDKARERRSFWKRKPNRDPPVPGAFQRSVSATPSIPTSHGISSPSLPLSNARSSEANASRLDLEPSIHKQCMSLLRDLDSLVGEFEQLSIESRQRRGLLLNSAVSRHSLESQNEEFYDAQTFDNSELLAIHHETDDEESDHVSISSASSNSSKDADHRLSGLSLRERKFSDATAFPVKADSLDPLPSAPIKRRTQVQPPVTTPPSLIGFLRKNVGKDLATIAMPVSANEPLSLLQRGAEVFEYSTLLDSAARARSSTDRLAFVTAFAISGLSNSRVRERTIRKPFNPMLGETYELVREDRTFRFLAEKVSHRPVQLACQAEGPHWTISQSPLPSQKFWGKSVELMTEGKVHAFLHATGECFIWTPATSFLRNIIAGEKYVEPVGSMTIGNNTNGEKAVVTFKSGGMFSGRSEDVTVETLDANGAKLPVGLVGKWTSSLAITDHEIVRQTDNPIWTAGDLSSNAAKGYGFTVFAASLNEITSLEAGRLPPTDSRLRPDQRAAESGYLDRAETLKATLEEAQRNRRREMEESGIQWRPQWFEKTQIAEGEEVWTQKRGKDGYWSRRQESRWDGITNVFDVK